MTEHNSIRLTTSIQKLIRHKINNVILKKNEVELNRSQNTQNTQNVMKNQMRERIKKSREIYRNN